MPGWSDEDASGRSANHTHTKDMARISIPTTARLPPTLRLDPSNTTVVKVLNRLTRPSLLTLVLDWLDDTNVPLCTPYLREPPQDDDDDDVDDATDLYPPAYSLEELREIYTDLQARRGSKREVLDRILEGDWRQGVTLYQVSMADIQYLYDHPQSQKWSAYRIKALKTPTPRQAAEEEDPLKVDAESLSVPRFHPSTFLQNLQSSVLPDVKAHYNFDRPKDMPLLLLRLFILDSPYNTNLATSAAGGGNSNKKAATTTSPSSATGFDASRTIYVAFPDGSPYVYISKPQTTGPSATGETRSLLALLVAGIPKALSRPRARYGLAPTRLVTRNMQELLHRRGPGRTNTAGGGWGVYADERKKESPLDAVLPPSPPLSEADEEGEGAAAKTAGAPRRKRAASPATEEAGRRAKRARLVARARFGDSAKVDDGKGVERVDIVIDDPYPAGGGNVPGDVEGDGEDDDGDDNPLPRTWAAAAGRRSTTDAAFDQVRRQDDDQQAGDEEDGRVGGGEDSWRPGVKLIFHGSHVFAGIRQLVEAGVIDGEKMPGWLTGEEGVTIGAVRHGRIRGHQGSSA